MAAFVGTGRGRAWAVRLLRIVVLVYVGLAATLVIFEKHFVYIPDRELELTPAALGLRSEDVWLTTEDGVRIHAWWLPARNARGTLLYCHGNAGNISHRLDRIIRLQGKLALNVLIFDYRGYGRSEGSPDEEGTYRDARAAYGHLVQARGIAPHELILFGESLGCAVALDTARERKSRALVLEAPFTSIPDMAQTLFPVLPLKPFLRTRYDNLAKISRLDVPLLVFHGEKDRTVPFAQGRRLFDAAQEPKCFFPVPGGGHNDAYLVAGDSYWRAWRDFLDGS